MRKREDNPRVIEKSLGKRMEGARKMKTRRRKAKKKKLYFKISPRYRRPA